MTGTCLGRPDRSLSETQKTLAFFTNSFAGHFLFGAFLLSTGELIGEGGMHTLNSEMAGWPEVGYKFMKEYWGRGYATEFLGAVLGAWWGLNRQGTEVDVYVLTMDGKVTKAGAEIGAGNMVTEKVYANTEIDNVASQKVLEKLGFVKFIEWTEPDTQEHRLGEPVTLVGFILSRPRS
ncbi:GNAT domain-containing protein [Pseudomassariella vexata]|uniref:GNAT domain-domain-containing protein n=1 Tax=Pseudomassariella vexata TaxID=1141098 RepID=A0A1Y2DNY0_9PEZI|nr:GNAT domain-containing protein [Pseudomassariella vexata]ORY60874.1 GNAT domain-domain-containing protein [Pseudomassariella vexata]